MDEVLGVDLDILTWALERAGGDPCDFAGDGDGPDHHGPEFAKVLFDALKAEIEEYDLLRGANK